MAVAIDYAGNRAAQQLPDVTAISSVLLLLAG